ncbi:MAG TPA: polysaccharide deacetylase family protein [Bacillota bacterium]
MIALTFDDGPDDVFTPRILDQLREQRVPATFFVTGIMADRYPAVMQRIVDEGHAVASHGYRHIRYSAVTPEAIREDLDRNRRLLERYTGEPVPWFRPPYGALDRLAATLVLEEGYRIVLWTIDTRDWMGRSAAEITETVLGEAHNGAIVLQHSASGGDVDLSGTVAALPRFIAGLRQRGFTFVTVPELLAATRTAQGAGPQTRP